MDANQIQILRAAPAAITSALDELDRLTKENAELRKRLDGTSPEPEPAKGWAFGVYVPDLPTGRTDLPALEKLLGRQVPLVSAFTDWTYILGGPNDVWMADDGKRRILYSWEPFGLRFAAIAAGGQDGYLHRVADSMLKFPHDIYVRPWGEMNANWSSWQPTPDGSKRDGGTPEEFVAAWRHVVDLFRSRGVKNLKFVFAPDSSDFTNNTPIPTIWPGADYVDVLGIDGYNWGANTATGDTWRDFVTIFANMYGILTKLHPSAPVWVCEVGCKEPARNDGAPVDLTHTKAVWVRDMIAALDAGRFPRLSAVAWFNVRKERDWRLESTVASIAAVKVRLAKQS